MDHIRNRRRPSTRTTVTVLVIAAVATCAERATARDCEPSAVHVDLEGQPLTREERIARLDQALHDSLARFDECQTAASAAAGQDAGAEGSGSGTAGAGGDAGGAGDSAAGEGGDAAGGSVAADGVQGADAPEATEPAAGGATIESVPADGVQGTEAPEDRETTPSSPELPPDSGPGSGDVPDDIPAPDNDSVLEAQIRRAAMEETDPRVRAELWNEYRKYKGLPTRPLPEDDGDQSDAQTSE